MVADHYSPHRPGFPAFWRPVGGRYLALTSHTPTPADRSASIVTYKLRRRPLTAGQRADLDRLEHRYGLAITGPPLASTDRPLVLDIGIGFGDTTVRMAAAEPDVDIIGCDVHTPGVLSTLLAIEKRQLTNVRVAHGDAVTFLNRLAPASLAGVRLYFPDPWPKARHRRRRMVTEARLGALVDLLAPGGTLHIATDIADYATQALRVATAHDGLTGGRIERPHWRPVTRFEAKAQAAGRRVTDLLFTRC